ncbi:MAG: hypothetical protein ACREQA_17895 [Candidatus Binatia bacterium]
MQEMENMILGQQTENQETKSIGLEISLIVHDLRNFMTILLFMVENLLKSLDDPAVGKTIIEELGDVTCKMNCLVEKFGKRFSRAGLIKDEAQRP